MQINLLSFIHPSSPLLLFLTEAPCSLLFFTLLLNFLFLVFFVSQHTFQPEMGRGGKCHGAAADEPVDLGSLHVFGSSLADTSHQRKQAEKHHVHLPPPPPHAPPQSFPISPTMHTESCYYPDYTDESLRSSHSYSAHADCNLEITPNEEFFKNMAAALCLQQHSVLFPNGFPGMESIFPPFCPAGGPASQPPPHLFAALTAPPNLHTSHLPPSPLIGGDWFSWKEVIIIVSAANLSG